MVEVYIIGTGMGGTDSLTLQAKEIIDGADCLIGAQRMLEPYSEDPRQQYCAYKYDEITEIISGLEDCAAVVLMSGDSGFHSGTKKLLPMLEALEEVEVTVIPGISTLSYLCARHKVDYNDVKLLSLHGGYDNIAVNVALNKRCFFLMGGKITVPTLCSRLIKYGLEDVTIRAGENLGYKEFVCTDSPKVFENMHFGRLTALLIENENAVGSVPACIDDDKFERDPAVPVTKAEIRAIAAAMLNIEKDSVCYDIGCGTGSVSVEMALRCTDGTVFAIDKSSRATSLTDTNSRGFSCDNIKTVLGECPHALIKLPAPDKVFIGGSTGQLANIFSCVRSKNPRADIVLTAVTLETLEQAREAFGQYGGSYSITQVSVNRTNPLGGKDMLSPLTSVFIVKGRLS